MSNQETLSVKFAKIDTKVDFISEDVKQLQKDVTEINGILKNGLGERTKRIENAVKKLGEKVDIVDDENDQTSHQVDLLLEKISNNNKKARKHWGFKDIMQIAGVIAVLFFLIFNSIKGNNIGIGLETPDGTKLELNSEAPPEE